MRDNQAKWKNPKQVAQYYMTLLGEAENGARAENDCCAPIHDVPVGEVDTAMVLSVLGPIWYTSFSEGR